MTDFLGLQLVFRAKAEDLFKNFEQFTSEFSLDLNRMIAIGTDGASNLCGCKNSLFTYLKTKYPRLILFKCICHSLDKCAQNACAELPSHLEFLLRETRFWFCHSLLRIQFYGDLYKSLTGKAPPKLSYQTPVGYPSIMQQNRI